MEKSKMDKKAFTLIELLVVIAIIGVLVTLISVVLVNSQKKSRDAKKMSDLTAVSNALQLYYTDKQAYPDTNFAGLIALLESDPKYLDLALDTSGSNYKYIYDAPNKTYHLYFKPELDESASCSSCTPPLYIIKNGKVSSSL